MSDDDTYYDELGVEPTASRDELKAAYQERISELEAAARVRASTRRNSSATARKSRRVRAAWNVLADPFQRTRYDASLDSASTNGEGSDADVDADGGNDGESEQPAVQLTGWRRLMAPPPPKPARPAAGNGKQPPARRPLREPTIQLPPGMRFAEPQREGCRCSSTSRSSSSSTG